MAKQSKFLQCQLWLNRAKLIAVPLMMMIAVVVAWSCLTTSASEFINKAFTQLNGGAGEEVSETITFDSGETAKFMLEHDCCSGAGFDAVAIKFSDGREFSSKLNYCGMEGFWGVMQPTESGNLDAFAEKLKASGYKLR